MSIAGDTEKQPLEFIKGHDLDGAIILLSCLFACIGFGSGIRVSC
jgi:hypothetical protein